MGSVPGEEPLRMTTSATTTTTTVLDQFLYLSESKILHLPSFEEVACQQDFPESPMSYASAGVVLDNNLMVCGGNGMTTCRIWTEDGWAESATGLNRRNAAASSVDA